MKLAGWENRLEAHERRMKRLDMDSIHKWNRKEWERMHQRFGYLQAKVEALREEAERTKEI